MYESVTQYNLYKVRINIGSISEYNPIEIILNKSNRSNHEIVSDILRAIDIDGAIPPQYTAWYIVHFQSLMWTSRIITTNW